MTLSMILTLAVVILMVAVIISDKLPFGAPPIIACALLVVLNQASVADAFGGFVDKNVIMICGFMVCMAALQKTTFIAKVKGLLGRMAGKGGMRNYALLLLVIMFIGNFLTGTAYYVLILSVVATIPYKKELPNSRILLPAAMASCFGGWIPANVAFFVGLMASLLDSAGVSGASVSFASLSISKVISAVAFFLWAMLAFRLLPDHDINAGEESKKDLEKSEESAAALTKTQETVVYVSFIALLICMLFLSKLPGEVGYAVPAVIAGLYLCTGVINFKEFLGQWFSPLCVMMAGVIGVATAMSNCGLTTLIGEHIAGVLGANPAPFVIVLVFTLLTSIAATFTGAAIGSIFIFAPIGVSVCMQLGLNPTAVVFACVQAGWINYFMPIDGLPALAMGMGKYKLADFWKFMVPLWLINILAVVGSAVWLFPM